MNIFYNRMKRVKLTIIFIEEPEGGYAVTVKELPEAISYGSTIEEALENIHDAIQTVLLYE